MSPFSSADATAASNMLPAPRPRTGELLGLRAALQTQRLLAVDRVAAADRITPVDPISGREREVFAQLGKGGDVANSDLEAICRLWPVGRVRVADRGLREGILFRLMGRHSLDGRGVPA